MKIDTTHFPSLDAQESLPPLDTNADSKLTKEDDALKRKKEKKKKSFQQMQAELRMRQEGFALFLSLVSEVEKWAK